MSARSELVCGIGRRNGWQRDIGYRMARCDAVSLVLQDRSERALRVITGLSALPVR